MLVLGDPRNDEDLHASRDERRHEVARIRLHPPLAPGGGEGRFAVDRRRRSDRSEHQGDLWKLDHRKAISTMFSLIHVAVNRGLD